MDEHRRECQQRRRDHAGDAAAKLHASIAVAHTASAADSDHDARRAVDAGDRVRNRHQQRQSRRIGRRLDAASVGRRAPAERRVSAIGSGMSAS